MSRPADPVDTLGRVDAEIARLSAACEALAANLVDLDVDPAKESLARGPLTGHTKAEWDTVNAALARLWEGHGLLSDVLATARALRNQRRVNDQDRARLDQMLFGASITPPGAAPSTPAQLLTDLEAAYTTARATITTAGSLWSELLAATATTSTRLDDVRAKIIAAGADPATINDAALALRTFMATLAGDPLGCRRDDLDRIDVTLTRAEAELTSAADLAAAVTERLADAHRITDQITAAERDAVTAQTSAAQKLTPAHVIATPADVSLRVDLVALDALAAANQWPTLSGRLAAWTTRARQHLTAVESARNHNTAALAERDELRGRLSAYKAKAARLGYSEHPQLSQLAEAAHQHLYTAPCDLVDARRAVDAYQTTIAQLTSASAQNRGLR